MAEHEVTEAMVDAALDSLGYSKARRGSFVAPRDLMRTALEVALAARTTPQPTDASAANGVPNPDHTDIGSVYEQAEAWETIVRMLDELSPGWNAITGTGSGTNLACVAIRKLLTHPTGAGADSDARGSCSQTPECVYRKTRRFLGDPRESVGVGCNNDVGTNASSPQQRAGDGG